MPIDTKTAQAGDTFRASLSAPLVVNGETVVPANVDVEGKVVEAKSAGRFAGQSSLTLELTGLSVNGENYNLQSNQWTKQASSTGKKTATKVGVGRRWERLWVGSPAVVRVRRSGPRRGPAPEPACRLPLAERKLFSPPRPC